MDITIGDWINILIQQKEQWIAIFKSYILLPNKWLDSKDRVGNYNAGYVIFNVGDIGLRIDKGRNNHVHHCIAVIECTSVCNQ